MIRAEVEMIGNAPAPYAQGIYATPGRHDALIRFSSASNHLGPDAALGPVLGFAIKIFDVGGTKQVEDEPDSATFDLVLKNSPTFIANTAKHYLFIQEVGDQVPNYLKRGEAGFRQLLTDFLTGKGTLDQDDWAWEETAAACGCRMAWARCPSQGHQSEPGSESFMIAKTFAPFPGVKPFAIMEISRLTTRQAWPATPALPAR